MNFWMFPLWTRVTLLRLWAMAYWIALRTSRLLPNSEIGLMPMPLPGRIFLPRPAMNSITRFASSVPAFHSMPA